jgi:hypothetical protein
MKMKTRFTVAFLSIAVAHTGFGQESGNAVLRKRTDANVEQDIKANLAYLRELAEQKKRAEEANRLQDSHVELASENEPITAAVSAPSRQSTIAPPSPPVYRGGSMSNMTGRSIERLSPEFSWLPKAPQIDRTDLEAMQRPSLQSTSSDVVIGEKAVSGIETSQQVRLASYQDATTAPVLPYSNPLPGFQPPATSTPLNAQPAPTFPAPGTTFGQNQPGVIGSNPPSIPNVANPANLPQYPKPQQRPAFVNNEPFVTGPPCQYDAYDMVMPTSYNAPGYPVCGGPSVFPGAPPAGSMGDAYVPPTLTPNYGPGLYSSNNSGFRPLFSLGQENYNAQLGRGIIGQPTAYVPGQPFRNFFRYLSP